MVRTKIAIAWLFSFCVLQAFGQEDIHLRINQIRYSPNDTKIAVAFSKKAFRERVLLVDATTEIVKMEIIPQRIETDDWGVFPYYFTIDFSQVEAPGAYFLKTCIQVFMSCLVSKCPVGWLMAPSTELYTNNF